MNPTPIDAHEAKKKLQEGQFVFVHLDQRLVVLFDSTNKSSVARLAKLQHDEPTIEYAILIESDARLNRLLPTFPSLTWDLLDSASDGMILRIPAKDRINQSLVYEDGSVAIMRVLDETLVRLFRNWPMAVGAMMVYDVRKKLCNDWSQYPSSVLAEVEYVLNLPDLIPAKLTRAIPTISLGAENEVRIIRA